MTSDVFSFFEVEGRGLYDLMLVGGTNFVDLFLLCDCLEPYDFIVVVELSSVISISSRVVF